MNLLHKKHVRLLSQYLPEQPLAPDMLKQWQVSEPEYMYVYMYVYVCMYVCMYICMHVCKILLVWMYE